MTEAESICTRELHEALDEVGRVRDALRRVYQGPDAVVDALLVALLARGHVLLEGVPGVAKTTLASAFAHAIGGVFRRIQFTPDLLPSDITGGVVLDMRTSTFELRRGPIFANVILGDELNRAPAKTQSAMLEAMAEGQVTIEGTTLPLPAPFLVLATQNPVEQEGVYPLPESQLDRFLVRVIVPYPSHEDELRMLRVHGAGRTGVEAVVTMDRVEMLAALAERVSMGDPIRRYIVDLARATRVLSGVAVGASPRASLSLLRAARSHALLRGRDHVGVDDVRAMVGPVFAHRLISQGGSLSDGHDGAAIVRQVVRSVPYDPA